MKLSSPQDTPMLILKGGYGTIYKGKLSDEVFVAVKIVKNS